MAIKKHIQHHSDAAEVVAENIVQEHELDEKVHEFANLSAPLEETPEPAVSPLAWLSVVVLLITGIALVLNIFFPLKNLSSIFNVSQTESSTPTPKPLEKPTATPIPPKSKDQIKIHVLNGTGKSGIAADAKTYLQSIGYTNIDTGNADNFKNENSVFSTRPGMDDLKTSLFSDLKNKFKMDSSIGDLPVTGIYDAEIILGKN